MPIISDGFEIINSLETTKYYELPSDMIGKISFYGKSVNTLKDNKDTRISKRLYIPASRLRGFESGKVGPVENTDYIGGNYISTINFTTTLPQVLPSLQILDFSFFVDYNENLSKSDIRSSLGLGVDLLTPIGPMSFSFSEVISKSTTDTTESFRFNIGTTF